MAKHNHFFFNFQSVTYRLKFLKTAKQRSVGLLNHLSISPQEGIIMKKPIIAHTFGMDFPIEGLILNKNFEPIGPKFTMLPGKFFWLKRGAYLIEIPLESYLKKKKPIHLGENIECASQKTHLIKTILVLSCFSHILYSQDVMQPIYLNMSENKVIDLNKPPESIEVYNPEVLDVKRLGLSNSIELQPLKTGSTLVHIHYPKDESLIYNVTVAKGSAYKKKLNITSSLKSYLTKEIQKINSIKVEKDGDKIVLLGTINSLNQFRKILTIIAPYPDIFSVTYKIESHIEKEVFKTLKEDMSYLGEKNLTFLSKQGLIFLNGSFSSEDNKKKVLEYLYRVLPPFIDATESLYSLTSVVQVDFKFIEINEGASLQLGVDIPSLLSLSLSQDKPFFHIAPTELFLKMLKKNNGIKEFAHPIILTRPGQIASFLAGGEIPVPSSFSNTSGRTDSVEFKKYGISISVTPRIHSKKTVSLETQLEMSKPSLLSGTVPSFRSQRIQNHITISEGETAIMSGLTQIQDSNVMSKIPFLGDIPLLGEIFKIRHQQSLESEIWIAISVQQNPAQSDQKLENLKQDIISSHKEF
jgi:pilus assembly protein CpaC